VTELTVVVIVYLYYPGRPLGYALTRVTGRRSRGARGRGLIVFTKVTRSVCVARSLGASSGSRLL